MLAWTSATDIAKKFFTQNMEITEHDNTVTKSFDNPDLGINPGEPAKCMIMFLSNTSPAAIEGWVIFVDGIHEEAQEEDIRDAFGDFGKIKNLHLNLDRKSGYVKGYSFIEFRDREEASRAISSRDGFELLGRRISVDWAFVGRSRMDVSSGIPRTKRPRN